MKFFGELGEVTVPCKSNSQSEFDELHYLGKIIDHHNKGNQTLNLGLGSRQGFSHLLLP